MGGELVELVINTLELTYPVGKGMLYLASTSVETTEEEKVADEKGPARSHCVWLGYRRAERRYAYRFVAVVLGMAVCVPLMVFLVWWIVRLTANP